MAFNVQPGRLAIGGENVEMGMTPGFHVVFENGVFSVKGLLVEPGNPKVILLQKLADDWNEKLNEERLKVKNESAGKLETVQKRLEESEKKLEKVEQDKTEIQEELRIQDEFMAGLEDQNMELQEQNRELQQEVQALETEKRGLDTKVKDLEQAKRAADQEKRKLLDDLNEVNRQDKSELQAKLLEEKEKTEMFKGFVDKVKHCTGYLDPQNQDPLSKEAMTKLEAHLQHQVVHWRQAATAESKWSELCRTQLQTMANLKADFESDKARLMETHKLELQLAMQRQKNDHLEFKMELDSAKEQNKKWKTLMGQLAGMAEIPEVANEENCAKILDCFEKKIKDLKDKVVKAEKEMKTAHSLMVRFGQGMGSSSAGTPGSSASGSGKRQRDGSGPGETGNMLDLDLGNKKKWPLIQETLEVKEEEDTDEADSDVEVLN